MRYPRGSGTAAERIATRRVDALGAELIRDTVGTASSWRQVARLLDLRAARDVVALRQRCDLEGVPTAHLPGLQADAAFREAVESAASWPGLLAHLGYAASSGSARATVRGRARRLGVDLTHLEGATLAGRPTGADDGRDLAALLGAPRLELLRMAAPAIFAGELLQRGCPVSWPLEPQPYDLVAHPPGGGALRIQVKSSTMRRGGSWDFRLVRGDRTCGGAYAADEIDAFGLVDGDRVSYLVPVALVEGQTSVCSGVVAPDRLLA